MTMNYQSIVARILDDMASKYTIPLHPNIRENLIKQYVEWLVTEENIVNAPKVTPKAKDKIFPEQFN